MEELEKQLIDVLNNSALPLEAKRYVVLSFMHTVESAYQQMKRNAQTEKEDSCSTK